MSAVDLDRRRRRTAAIRLERRDASRSTARKVLDDVSLDVAEGSGFCLLGRSGTGKSVTLKHIIGLMQARSRATCSCTART